jgi:hypothetical protein
MRQRNTVRVKEFTILLCACLSYTYILKVTGIVAYKALLTVTPCVRFVVGGRHATM